MTQHVAHRQSDEINRLKSEVERLARERDAIAIQCHDVIQSREAAIALAEAAEATFEDEQAAHEDTLRLLKAAERKLAMAVDALISIKEYWNGSATEGAMHDACYHNSNTAEEILAELEKTDD